MPSGAELFELVESLADACESDGRPGDLPDAEGRTSARVAIELGQHDPGQPETVVKRLRRLHRVLPDHGVNDEQNVLGRHGRLNLFELPHEGLVDRESAGRVVDDHVVLFAPGPLASLQADLERCCACHVEHRNLDLLAEHLELLDRRRSLHVRRDEQRPLALLLEPAGKLRAGRRLPRSLKAHHHDARRLALGSHHESGPFARRHEGDELVVADLDEDVAGRNLDRRAVSPLGAHPDDLAQGLFFHTREEHLDDTELDVSLEQRQSHLAKRRIDVLLRQLGQTGEAVSRRLEPFGEGIEHGQAAGLSTWRT